MGPYRRAGLLIVLFLIALFTALSYLQDPRPYLRPASLWDRFFYPIEINEEQRFFATNADLLRVFASGDGRTVWAGGRNGLVIRSGDGGATWKVLRERNPNFAREVIAELQFRGRNGWAVIQREWKSTGGEDRYTGTILRTRDGGETWRAPAKIPLGLFLSVNFIDDQTGWAVGPGGVVIHTRDGGDTWKVQLFDEKVPNLNKVRFADARNGYALDTRGRVLRTKDGGGQWTMSEINKAGITQYLRVMDPETVMVADRRGGVFRSLNGGRDWKKNGPGTIEKQDGRPLYNRLILAFGDEDRGCGVNVLGRPYYTRDGGGTWRLGLHETSDPDLSKVNELYCSVREYGWAAGDDGAIFTTRDGGRSWRRQTSRSYTNISLQSLRSRARMESNRIFLSDDGGRSWREYGRFPFGTNAVGPFIRDKERAWFGGSRIHRTIDGGITWQAVYRGGFTNAIFFTDRYRGWAVGRNGLVLRSRDGGRTWERRASKSRANLRSIFFLPNAVNGWAAGENLILRSIDGGASWKKSGTVNGLVRSVRFTDEKNGWAAGAGGLLLQSTDGGVSWRRRDSTTNRDITTILFENRDRGYLFNGNFLLRRTTDGGRTWFRPRWIVLPAPWFFLFFTWLGVILILILRRRNTPFDTSIANRPVSDRPLRERDEDRLNFVPLALGLSNFVRNENTMPPLTIAITGEWGTGKSSLMNLVREDLAIHRFDPVFFNAWHHQKEEHLLAALLENIRLQGVPAWWRPRNWFFRLRLFFIRTRESWPVLALLGVAYAFVLGIFHESLADSEGVRVFLGTVFDAKLWKEGLGAGFAGMLDALGRGGGPLAFLAGNVVLLGYLMNMARAFGEHPAKLLAGLKGNFTIRDIKAQTGFRYRFSREFGDVTRALGHRKMVIFIDDLDRCRPENVIDVLETVNFLASAGECVIVLGLALERVRKCVALAFKDISGGEAAPGADEAFAEEYLKKLINIEVAVPRATSEQIERLLDSDERREEEEQEDQMTRKEKILAWSREAGRILLHAAPTVLVILIITATALAVHQLGRLIGPTAARQVRPGPVAGGPGTGGGIRPVGRLNQGLGAGPRTGIGKRAPSFASEYPRAILPSAMVVFAFLFILFLIRYVGAGRDADIVRDNTDFVDAWKIWRRLVFAADAKPREVKRFLNMVRLYAMRQRRSRPGLYPRERIGIMARLSNPPRVEKPDVEDGGIVPEDFLVALCAIQFYKSVFVDEPAELYLSFQDPKYRIPDEDIMGDCIVEHIERFQRRYLPESYIQRLKYYQDGIQLN